MADDRVKAAVEVIARHALARVIHEDSLWDLYPEIGEFDWEAVEREIARRVAMFEPSAEEFNAAYEFLEDRAQDEF